MKFGGLVVLVSCVACGEVADPNKLADAPLAPDGGADAPVDGPPMDAPPRCDPAKPFGAPMPIAELNTAMSEVTPYLSQDELQILFASNRTGGVGGMDIYLASRTSPTGTFDAPILLPGVNTTMAESRPMVTMGRLRLYVETNTTGMPADWEISGATRASTAAAFGAWAAIPQLNSTTADTAPFVLPDDSAIYFMSNRAVGGAHELWKSDHPGGNWTTPAAVPGVNLNDATMDYPFLTPDELTLYFSSSRTGGAGSRDIWMATRTSTTMRFSDPINIAALNTTASESGGWVSADNCVIYFTRDIGVAAANPQIFRAEKPL